MSIKSLREQNIFPLTLQYIEVIKKIGELSNLSNWTFSDYAEEIERNDSVGFIYKNNETENITGFIITRLIIIQKLDSQVIRDIRECEILNIAVHPSFRRNGIAQQLFEATVERCLSKNVEFIWLEVRKNNDEAIRFYQRNGFEIVYTRKDYYYNPSEDALVMKAQLSKTI